MWMQSWLVLLAGCSLTKSSTMTLGGSPGPTATSRSGGDASGGGASGGGVPSSGGGDGMVTVPDLIGKTQDEARALVKAAGFASEPETSRPVECQDPAHDAGRINCQDPEAGKVVKRYTTIAVRVYQPTVIKGAIVRSQLATLKGMTPDQAKAQLKKFGHDGTVNIGVIRDYGGGQIYRKECGENRVCETTGESGIGVHDDITLLINPTLSIAPPPP